MHLKNCFFQRLYVISNFITRRVQSTIKHQMSAAEYEEVLTYVFLFEAKTVMMENIDEKGSRNH